MALTLQCHFPVWPRENLDQAGLILVYVAGADSVSPEDAAMSFEDVQSLRGPRHLIHTT